jgi:hypothetical protein
VARAIRRKIVTLDDAGKTLALRYARNVDFLADFEDVGADDPADLRLRQLVGRDPKFLEDVAALDARLGVVPGGGLVDAARPALAKATCTAT